MQLLETRTLYANPDPLLVSRQAAFPGLIRLPDGKLLAMFSIGQAFDAADMRAYVSISKDNGQTWGPPTQLHDSQFDPMESESFKPLLLADGSLLATGYVFVRPDTLTPIVDPATNAILPIHNKLSRSVDGGLIWSTPERFAIDDVGLELSGPFIQLASGRILGAAAPFHLGASGHEGWLFGSDDNGASWQRQSVFFRSEGGHIAPWECRLIDFGHERIGVLFWAYDLASDHHLSNRLALSDDGGKSFAIIDTGISGQASNAIALGPNEMLSIHAHRETPVGLKVYRLKLAGGAVEVTDTLSLFGDEKLGQGRERNGDPFANLRFGQPGLLALGEGNYLASCWQVENCQHVIKTFRIRF
ncbi:MAG: sialidase family protein [Cypionkella sp.]